jgi:hypothetical protein
MHWVRSIQDADSALAAVGSKAWFQLDREGDRYWTLRAPHDSNQWLTVRSTVRHGLPIWRLAATKPTLLTLDHHVCARPRDPSGDQARCSTPPPFPFLKPPLATATTEPTTRLRVRGNLFSERR